MKRILINLTYAFVLSFFSSTYAQSKSIVVLLPEDDTTKVDGILVMTYKLRDNFRIQCSYEEGIAAIKEKAEAKGANLIKITKHKVPDMWSTCHRFEADLYHVENIGDYEKEIIWSADRQLEWEDFRAPKVLQEKPDIGAQTYCGISFQTNTVNIFKKPKFFVHTTFYKDSSWVIKDSILNRTSLLNHERKHFDLCEVYARMLYKRLLEADFSVQNLYKAKSIYVQVFEKYFERQEQYDAETQHGIIQEEQKKWDKIISDELAALAEYADHD